MSSITYHNEPPFHNILARSNFRWIKATADNGGVAIIPFSADLKGECLASLEQRAMAYAQRDGDAA